MDEEAFNRSVRKFLKKVGVTSQQEIERLVDEARAAGKLADDGQFKVKVRLETELSDQPFEIPGTIELA